MVETVHVPEGTSLLLLLLVLVFITIIIIIAIHFKNKEFLALLFGILCVTNKYILFQVSLSSLEFVERYYVPLRISAGTS
jgi:hypothetical protein